MSHCSFHSKEKKDFTLIYGDAHLYEKKKITHFLLNNGVDFEPVDSKNNIYEAKIKVRDLSPAMKKAILKDKQTMGRIETMMQLMSSDGHSTDRSKKSKDSDAMGTDLKQSRCLKNNIYEIDSYRDQGEGSLGKKSTDPDQRIGSYDSFSFVKDNLTHSSQHAQSVSSKNDFAYQLVSEKPQILIDEGIFGENQKLQNQNSLGYNKAVHSKLDDDDEQDFVRSFESKKITERLPNELFEIISNSGKKTQGEDTRGDSDFSFLRVGRDFIEKSLSSTDHRLDYDSGAFFGQNSSLKKDENSDEVARRNADFLNKILLNYDKLKESESYEAKLFSVAPIEPEKEKEDNDFKKHVEQLRKINQGFGQEPPQKVEGKHRSFLNPGIDQPGLVVPDENPKAPNPSKKASESSLKRSQEDLKASREINTNPPAPKTSQVASREDLSRQSSVKRTNREGSIETDKPLSSGRNNNTHRSQQEEEKGVGKKEDATTDDFYAVEKLLTKLFPNISFPKVIKILSSENDKSPRYKRVGDLPKEKSVPILSSQENNFLSQFLKNHAKKVFEDLDYESMKRSLSPEKEKSERWRSPGASSKTFDSQYNIQSQPKHDSSKPIIVETFDARGPAKNQTPKRSKSPLEIAKEAKNQKAILREKENQKSQSPQQRMADPDLDSEEGWIKVQEMQKENLQTKKKIEKIFYYGQRPQTSSRKVKEAESKFNEKVKQMIVITPPKSPRSISPRDPNRLVTITEKTNQSNPSQQSHGTERSVQTERSNRSKTPDKEGGEPEKQRGEENFAAIAWKTNSKNFEIYKKKKLVQKQYSEISNTTLAKSKVYHDKKANKIERQIAPKKKAAPKIEELSSKDILKLQQAKIDKAKVLEVDYIRQNLRESTQRSRSRHKAEDSGEVEILTTQKESLQSIK